MFTFVKQPVKKRKNSHVNWARLTGGTNAVVSADLQHCVGKPHCCLTCRVTDAGQVLTVGHRAGVRNAGRMKREDNEFFLNLVLHHYSTFCKA